MIKTIRLLAVVCSLLASVAIVKVAVAEPAAKDPTIAWQQVVAGATLIDVRTAEEFQQGHLAGAINIPYQLIVAGAKHYQLPADGAVVVYCRSGRRSGIAEQALEQAGFQQVYNGGGYVSLLESEHNPHQ
ncbi:rhodanese-like domain-containing protein [Neiella marina]|uniref:Rhodanese-like domain-containing protein n=1 Tax=Neiella holothuriorum TaxID=2870530 RepID=A0ABS7EBB9_9GAMM|nr:rhodanese-like domain-containing protein [Neiella holothuriorum]MBW8189619.1 rhodanese-like domain-containing protein [Neiella holothuriorum]